MHEERKNLDFIPLIDPAVTTRFEEVAIENGTSATEVLTDFMKDYIVSNGHPEQVRNRWPWNKPV